MLAFIDRHDCLWLSPFLHVQLIHQPSRLLLLLSHFILPLSWISEANSTSRLWVSSVAIFKESVGFEVLTTMAMKCTVFWVVTPCHSDGAQHFRGWLTLLHLGFCLLLVCSCLAYSWTLKMEAICSSETLIRVRTTWLCNPENRIYSSKNASNKQRMPISFIAFGIAHISAVVAAPTPESATVDSSGRGSLISSK
jgi:hypothetical protein